MRLLRVLAVASGLSVLALQSSAAQGDRQFKDAWFWGVKGGALMYTSNSTGGGTAPLAGGEWLITRSKGGLYLSLDQAFFTTTGGFVDRDPDSTSAFVRNVNLSNMRRFSVAGMIFPMQTNRMHPYFGAGLSFNQIAAVDFVVPITNQNRFQVANDSVQARKVGISPIFIGGLQYRYRPASVFAHVALSPIMKSFFLSDPNTGRPFNISLELGARYNVGSSIDRGR